MLDLDLIAEYAYNEISVIPTRKDKSPAISTWKKYQQERITEDQVPEAFVGAHGVGVICGGISNGLECIDFDAHGKGIDDIYKRWSEINYVADILRRNNVYTEKTPGGGYHVLYKYECDGARDGNKKLAGWDTGESMIETRGEGGYVVVAPTSHYAPIYGDLLAIGTMTRDERDRLLDAARTFNIHESGDKSGGDEHENNAFHHTDPISWFNWNKAGFVKSILIDAGWQKVRYEDKTRSEHWRRPGKETGTSATWLDDRASFYVFSSSVDKLRQNCYYTPFQLLIIYRFGGSYKGALNWIISKYFTEDIPYVRVGTDYFKKVFKEDRYHITRMELKAWKKDEIKQDHGPAYLRKIPLFDDFVIVPDNINYNPVIKNCYNLYHRFSHKPKEGSTKWSDILMKHVFEDQLELGYRYMKALYLHPSRILPILVLVSSKRQTGKTTYLNWLNMIFGDNMVNIAPDDFTSGFNFLYSTSNIIAVEETLIEKSLTIEKVKALVTSKHISVNQKFVSQFKIPFYGKIILTSNNEDKFARVDQEEIRFFVRKLGTPTHTNHNIEDDLMAEIPAFLHKLTQIPEIDWSRDRTGFTPEELANEPLQRVKEESMSWLYKELTELFTDLFTDNYAYDYIYARPTDVKNYFFKTNPKVEISYIRKVLRNEFKFETEKHSSYKPDECLGQRGINGTPFLIPRNRFTDEEGIAHAQGDETDVPF